MINSIVLWTTLILISLVMIVIIRTIISHVKIISHHPFYLGFIFILFSSCLLYPNPLNIISFIGAWIIHHFIMIEEEKYLKSRYREKYSQYKLRIKRNIILKFW